MSWNNNKFKACITVFQLEPIEHGSGLKCSISPPKLKKQKDSFCVLIVPEFIPQGLGSSTYQLMQRSCVHDDCPVCECWKHVEDGEKSKFKNVIIDILTRGLTHRRETRKHGAESNSRIAYLWVEIITGSKNVSLLLNLNQLSMETDSNVLCHCNKKIRIFVFWKCSCLYSIRIRVEYIPLDARIMCSRTWWRVECSKLVQDRTQER